MHDSSQIKILDLPPKPPTPPPTPTPIIIGGDWIGNVLLIWIGTIAAGYIGNNLNDSFNNSTQILYQRIQLQFFLNHRAVWWNVKTKPIMVYLQWNSKYFINKNVFYFYIFLNVFVIKFKNLIFIKYIKIKIFTSLLFNIFKI